MLFVETAIEPRFVPCNWGSDPRFPFACPFSPFSRLSPLSVPILTEKSLAGPRQEPACPHLARHRLFHRPDFLGLELEPTRSFSANHKAALLSACLLFKVGGLSLKFVTRPHRAGRPHRWRTTAATLLWASRLQTECTATAASTRGFFPSPPPPLPQASPSIPLVPRDPCPIARDNHVLRTETRLLRYVVTQPVPAARASGKMALPAMYVSYNSVPLYAPQAQAQAKGKAKAKGQTASQGPSLYSSMLNVPTQSLYSSASVRPRTRSAAVRFHEAWRCAPSSSSAHTRERRWARASMPQPQRCPCTAARRPRRRRPRSPASRRAPPLSDSCCGPARRASCSSRASRRAAPWRRPSWPSVT